MTVRDLNELRKLWPDWLQQRCRGGLQHAIGPQQGFVRRGKFGR